MSLVRFNISDRYQCVSGDVHGSLTDAFVAALTAEPETIIEYESALRRYVGTELGSTPLQFFLKNEDLEPYDAGIVAIDLPGRTVGFDTTYSIPCAAGRVRIPSEFSDDDEVWIPYRVPDDWMFVESMPLYRGTRITQREERLRRAPFDARPILFGRPMITYIALAMSDVSSPCGEEDFAAIHAEWLRSARKDLRDRSPREVFLEKLDFIDSDLQSRSFQWSLTKVCPLPLPKSSFAYLNAGFGMHEWVLYYDLFRFLLADAAERKAFREPVNIEAEIDRLSTLRDEWLRTPDPEISGRTPAEIIELERQRMNMTVSAKEALIDENCPCCVAMSQDFDTPMFWFLDGCNMDDRFEFSTYKTLEEWEAAQREREKFNREFEEKYREDPELKFWSAGGGADL
ncbi:MAG: hypothetical protein DMF63_16220 [Acidobacteria bacterium]|nr:MAG: hypothetical protein DMF63_16220 [Acidobacteriota bacterium]